MNRWFAFLAVGWVVGASIGAEADEGDRLNSFKAVFVYNFIGYVDWPDEQEFQVVKIGILGNSPLEAPLREIASKKRIGSKRLEVRTFPRAQDIDSCHVLLIAPEQAGELSEIAPRLDEWNALTIGDTPGRASRGVIINMVMVKEKLKFEVNMQALQRAGLRASSQLLKLAILVDEDAKG